MKNITSELDQIIEKYRSAFLQIPEEDFVISPAPGKWSKKQIIGHLVDSAHNNYRRFLTAQYEKEPPRIYYDQNFWVDANDYQTMKREELILLWALLNQRIIAVLNKMDGTSYERQVNTGRDTDELHSLRFIANDYIVHLKHHLHQIFPVA